MKLALSITLELNVPAGYTLTAEDRKDYRQVIDNALEQQAGFGGLTPNNLSDEGVGVDIFYVDVDWRREQQLSGEAFALWWDLEDVYNVATARSEEPLSETQAKAVLARLKQKADASTAIYWDEVAAAIDFVLKV